MTATHQTPAAGASFDTLPMPARILPLPGLGTLALDSTDPEERAPLIREQLRALGQPTQPTEVPATAAHR